MKILNVHILQTLFIFIHSIYFNFSQHSTDCTVNCTYRLLTNADSKSTQSPHEQSSFILSFSNNNQELENKYINNSHLFNEIITYFNYYICKDVYICTPTATNPTAAINANYPRQYGSTGHSSVLLVFPVASKELRYGCHITFYGDKLELGARHFIFTAEDIRAARKGRIITK